MLLRAPLYARYAPARTKTTTAAKIFRLVRLIRLLLPAGVPLDGPADPVEPQHVGEQAAPDDGEADEHRGQWIHLVPSRASVPSRIRCSSRLAASASTAAICARRIPNRATYSSVNAATLTSRAWTGGARPPP